MLQDNSTEYYTGREQRERALAAAAIDPAIAAIHLQVAERYAALVARSRIVDASQPAGVGATTLRGSTALRASIPA